MIDTIKNCQDKYKQEKGKVIAMKKHVKKMLRSKKGDGLGTIVMIILVLLLVGSLVVTKVAPLVSKTSGAGDTANVNVNTAITDTVAADGKLSPGGQTPKDLPNPAAGETTGGGGGGGGGTGDGTGGK